MSKPLSIPGLGTLADQTGLLSLDACSDGTFRVGRDGVERILTPADGRVEFVVFADRTLAYVKSALGYAAYYPVHPVQIERPVRAVLMDLDGTTVRSEPFWVWMIEQATASLLGRPSFSLETSDLPFVSGFSVSEHLQYCITKYCPDKTVEQARRYYFEHTRREMREILEGRGRTDVFVPTPGLRDFLLALKADGIRIGVVTSGLHEKAWPELVAAFRTMDLGDPAAFYDAIITAGYPVGHGRAGTLGELSPKPHPWLYAEISRIGLGIEFDQRNHVLGIEDSGAGVCAIRLAGFPTIGIAGGNIIQSGTRPLCEHYCDSLADVLTVIRSSEAA
ncbi:MAG: HAD hydrolase-like protein [Acidobacteria bacterium]|nr:HAD hydrolase-like protein [Acidobacteriota bacterium]